MKTQWFDVPSVPGIKVAADGSFLRDGKDVVTFGSISHAGYRIISFDGERYYAHRLVAEVFHGPPPDKRSVVNHKDGNKSNNRPNNLEWCTSRENSEHARATGLIDNRKAIRVWDILEDTILMFPSVTTAKEALNIAADLFYGKVMRGRYLVDHAKNPPPTVSLDHLRHRFVKIRSLETGKETLMINPSTAARFIGASESLVIKYLGKGFQYLKGHLIKPYSDPAPWWNGVRLQRAINKSGIVIVLRHGITGEEAIFDSVFSANGFQGLGFGRIRDTLYRGHQYVYRGWLVKTVSDETPWLGTEEVQERLDGDLGGILVRDPCGRTTIYNAVAEASKVIGIPSSTIRYRLKVGIQGDGYEIRRIVRENPTDAL